MLHNAHFPYGEGEVEVHIMPIIPHTAETYPGFCNHKANRGISDVKYIWNNSYIWTAVVDQSEEWSSQ